MHAPQQARCVFHPNRAAVEKCEKCDGSGAKSGTSPKNCGTCGGTGQIRDVRSSGFGQFVRITPCRKCNGSGKKIEHPCPECHGRGTVRMYRKISVDVPAGMDTGNRIRLPGEGETSSSGGPKGDLYVVIYIKPHETFQREGNHILYDAEISFVQAALGDEIEVPTLKGKAKLKIPKGSQTHTTFRLRGEGIQDVHGRGKGDEYVRIIVKTPTKLTDRQKQLLLELEELRQNDLPRLQAVDVRRYNNDWVEAIEVQNMLDVGEMIARSSLFRTESRGCFNREDYPEMDNDNWLCHTLLQKGEDGQMVFSKGAVVMTKYKPPSVEECLKGGDPMPI